MPSASPKPAAAPHAREVERELPDVVLLDIRLPGEDGLTLARYLRERYDVGIIMVTASGDVVDRVVGLEVGADDYITKPFDPRELLARVKSVLRRLQAAAGRAPRAGVAHQRAPSGAACSTGAPSLFDAGGAEVPSRHGVRPASRSSSTTRTGCSRATRS